MDHGGAGQEHGSDVTFAPRLRAYMPALLQVPRDIYSPSDLNLQ
jgi:hypothetical protein